jgi:membrane fusion protein, multidrug efflux system
MATQAVEDLIGQTKAAPAPPQTKAKSRMPLIVLAVVVAVLGVIGLRRWAFGRTHVSTDDAQVDAHVTPIAPKVQAFVAEVRVDDNVHVTAGDTLVVLDDRDLVVRLHQAEADLANATASAGGGRVGGQAQAQLAWSEAQASSADAAIAAAEASARKAAQDLDRVRGLAAQHVVPAQELDAAQAASDAAQANLAASRKQASAARSQVSAYGAGVTSANARVAAALGMVENARLQLGYTVITAPVSGIIAKRGVEPGTLVNIGQSLMTIVPDKDVWVTANLKETEVKDVTPNDRVTFTVDAYPGRTFAGHVESLSPATGARFSLLPPDNATGNFTKVVQRVPVRIAVDSGPDEAHPLRPGMSVVVTIATK